MSKHIIGVLLLWCGAAFAQGGWVRQTGPTTSDLMAVDFANAQTGVAVGAGRTIVRTTDGGATWAVVNAGEGSQLNAVSFADDTTGVAVGQDGQILFTQNGGAQWNVIREGWMDALNAAQQITPTVGVALGINPIMQCFGMKTANAWQTSDGFSFYVDHDSSGNEGAVYGLHFFSDSTGLAAVHIWDGNGAMVRTTDAGATWTTVYWNSYPLNAVTVPLNGANVVYAGGDYGEILTSTDRGASWTERNPPIDIDIAALCFANADTGWIVGGGGRIKRTNDGGIGWQDQPTPAGTEALHSVAFVNADTGFAVGDSGVILKTTTGGQAGNQPPGAFARAYPQDGGSFWYPLPGLVTFRWTPAHDPDGDTVRYHVYVNVWEFHFAFATVDTVLSDSLPGAWANFQMPVTWRVVATDGHDSTEATNGEGHFTILQPDAAKNPSAALPTRYDLSAYPNPFNPTTTLAISLPQAGPVTLTVFDVEGRKVMERAFGILNAGEHRVAFDGANLPSGVYISRLQTPRVQISWKMVLLK